MRASRAPRTPRDPEAERQRIEERTTERWELDDPIDAGVRAEALGATARATHGSARPIRPLGSPVDPAVAAEIAAVAPDRRIAERMVARLGQAQDALERDRLGEAKRLISQVARTVPGVAAVHEVAGLVAYRLGQWRAAVRELETAQALRPNVALLPVIADSYRGLRRWGEVERIWREIREQSPAQDVLAEARIVAAGAQADQGDLAGALRTMAGVSPSPKRVREHHLKLWYVVGDLNDRAGNQLEAIRWFERIGRHDDDYVDVRARLRALGRR